MLVLLFAYIFKQNETCYQTFKVIGKVWKCKHISQGYRMGEVFVC